MVQRVHSGEEQPPWLYPHSAYVHVPFCAHHCCYCDFAVVAGQDARIDAYLDALGCELRLLGKAHSVQTIFLGGGTPTHLDCRRLEKLLEITLDWLPLESNHEFSVEANPATLDAAKIGVLADHGVNRLSLGAQSFQPRLLQTLTRDHSPEDVVRAVEQAREKIADISLDMIFGVPGETLAEWESDLDRALALGPAHLSTYGLTYEKGTPLWKQRRSGKVQSLGEDAELAMYELAMDKLASAGFEHYEISSFARPGRRCRHNQVYWANHSYLGFGLGAARYVNGKRQVNTRDLSAYIRKTLAGQSPVVQSEVLGPEERARETLTLQLRRADGIDRRAFCLQTGFDLEALAGPVIKRLVALGLLQDQHGTVSLTRPGKCVADSLAREFL